MEQKRRQAGALQKMLLSEFDFDLPEDLIAQEPLEQRDASRMLVLDRATASWTDSYFEKFPSYLKREDIVVLNNSKVIPARLVGNRQGTGGRVEIFLVREQSPDVWEALVRPGARLRAGAQVDFGEGQLTAEILDEPGTELRRVRFACEGSFADKLAKLGSTPLPPYIKRPTGTSARDRERYQTVYARHNGAIAAPTAGLHFTPAILSEVKSIAKIAEVTLHVGYGTFEPVRVEDIAEHSVSGESVEISDAAAESINTARQAGGRSFIVGTTSVRALESAATEDGQIRSGKLQASLTIKPGYKFLTTDVLLTNFHLPKSSLLLLVSAFAGRELILRAYRHAVEHRYRFYSYGDCMLIL
jgi:S-adenosylmethionine:tRNA ribosyltransferase-isomerase